VKPIRDFILSASILRRSEPAKLTKPQCAPAQYLSFAALRRYHGKLPKTEAALATGRFCEICRPVRKLSAPQAGQSGIGTPS